MARPDWVHCIAEDHQDRIGLSLCGRKIGEPVLVKTDDKVLLRIDPDRKIKKLRASEWVFVDVGHWWQNAKSKGRLVGCPECVTAVQEAINHERGVLA